LAIIAIASTTLTVGKAYAQGGGLIGIIVSLPGDWFDGEIVQGADSKASALGYRTVVLYHEGKVNQQKTLFEMLISR
jgi:DNA-binding LacI/PurR family transcriptional regulator